MSGSDSEHDPSIRINIRTGTSTRRAQPPTFEQTIEPRRERVTVELTIQRPINPYTGLLTLLHTASPNIFNLILENSMNDGELERNEAIQLDIEERNCREEEIELECGICKERFQMGERLSTLDNCRHTFHHNCITTWGKYKQECALCRAIIPILER
uniref:RING-type domain-containing protein n=1 Tax=viral metagenome TaxID=1070528 RepID=A0A6C0EQ80_9ZZZZ